MVTPPSPKAKHSSRFFPVFVILATTLLVGIAGYGYVQNQKRLLMDEKARDLATIADLKTSQILQWRKERIIEATSIRANTMMAHRINDYINAREPSRVLEEFRTWMINLHDLAGFSRGMLFRTDGSVVSSISNDIWPPAPHDIAMVKESAHEQEILFSDFHSDENPEDIGASISIFIPILLYENSRPRSIAVVALDIDPKVILYPLIQSWPDNSVSSEALLVKRDGNDILYLNQPRFREPSVYPFRQPLARKDLPAAQAALGQEGSFEGIDYRGVPVLFAIRTIPGSPWALVVKVDISEIHAPVLDRIWYVAAACAMVVILISLGGLLWLMRRNSAYLRSQYEAERSYSSSLRQAELLLSDARDKLELRVTERTRELSLTNSRLRQEISERGRLEQQLLEAKKLESIGQIAGGVAHEVRNPLNAILTITEALFREKEFEHNPEYALYITHIRTQVTRLANLMNDLLDLGKVIPASSLRPVPLHELCCETITLWKSSGSAANKQIVLVFNDPPELLLVRADSMKLQQVFFNLIENAAQHNPKTSSVRFSILGADTPDNEQGMAIVQISDGGSGIAPDRIARIFDPFYSDRKGGTGLGLALVKHFIENMGGSVRIWNNDPPPGCTAEIRIPRTHEEHE